MKTFDLAEVRAFVDKIDTSIDQCDNGEGMECSNLETSLSQYAKLCRQFCQEVREWAVAVFSGRSSHDPEVESLWKSRGTLLRYRAVEALIYGTSQTEVCYPFAGEAVLGSALRDLERLLDLWVSPALAVGPSARQRPNLSPDALAVIRKQLTALPPLGADWEPGTPGQKQRLKKLRP